MSNENFIDYVKIFFHSGKGGSGSAHLQRTAQDPKAGPDGGDGGKGGDVILRGNRNHWTLLHLRYTKHMIAEDGGNGSANQCFGKMVKIFMSKFLWVQLLKIQKPENSWEKLQKMDKNTLL